MASLIGFAPSYYYAQNTKGAGIWIASGTFNGQQINGQLVSFYSAGTYYIGFDSNGNLLTGSSSNMPYLIAQVVVGQVITSGNLPTNTPFGGAKNPINASTLANVQYSLGIISITDMRNF